MEDSHSSIGSEHEFQQPCSCGSGKKAGSCCMANEPCPCGSGESAGKCCFKMSK
ncbi:SEC-C domain-containing protein [Candidatus Peregrinibacteria bacterium]|nr:SEC-C domain-containing protein [Candidatus Peregrinibacteria bacterium]